MVVKIYVSGISGNKEVKKRQQRVLMILDSRNIKYEIVDIAEPENEEQKDFMQTNSTALGATVGDANPRHPLPPQIFNDKIYCGDYDQFDMSNEIDELEKFLKLAPDDSAPTMTSNAEVKLDNGTSENKTDSNEKEEKIENGTDENVENESKNEETKTTQNSTENEEEKDKNEEGDSKDEEKDTEKEEDEENKEDVDNKKDDAGDKKDDVADKKDDVEDKKDDVEDKKDDVEEDEEEEDDEEEEKSKSEAESVKNEKKTDEVEANGDNKSERSGTRETTPEDS